jgi:RHS repeat-associated protein
LIGTPVNTPLSTPNGTPVGGFFSTPTIERQSFDPWGERRAPETLVSYRATDADPFRSSAQDYDRGYTGHEQLDDSGLIHMNGRIYDPELGRMLSPDPFVQVPEYSQNFNRYSYVMNNPLNLTDPSGFSWLSKAFKKIGNWFKENWRTVVVIVVAAVLVISGIGGAMFGALWGALGGGAVAAGSTLAFIGTGAVVGAITGGLGAALAGGSLGDVLRGAVIGGISGALTGALHPVGGTPLLDAANVVGHGVVGGASNVAMGGKFQDGFLSAAASAATAMTGLTSTDTGTYGGDHLNIASRTMIASVAGGTASALGGGKFANGALTGAMTHLLNAEGNLIKKALNNAVVIYRTARDSITSVSVFKNGEYLGGFVGNLDPDGTSDYAPGKRGPADGDYKLYPKPESDYDGGATEFVPGTPSITGTGQRIGSPDGGYPWGTVRFHPYGGSTACQTGPFEWVNRIWDLVASNPTKGVDLYIRTLSTPRAIIVGPNLPAPNSHPWPAFTHHKLPYP